MIKNTIAAQLWFLVKTRLVLQNLISAIIFEK
jgi:hypothetical protein